MNIDIIPLVSFVIITTFTPGPNNLSSASMGILYGFKKTGRFLAGIASGFFVVMICCAYLSSSLLTWMPSSERYLRWIGALYIVWLAMGTLRSGTVPDAANESTKAFAKGFILQLFNPKVAVYGLTLFSTFLSSVSRHAALLALFALAFALTAFAATATWAFCGSAIKNKLKNDTFRRRVNLALALMLIYTAVDLSGITTLWAAHQ